MKDGGIQENRYDAEYLRAEVSENGRRARFLYYNGELLAESEPDETVTGRYILGYGAAAGWQKGKERYHFYHLDEQNSTAYITDAGQGIENSYLYDAFGAIRVRQEGIHNRVLYTGQQHDQLTGQYYLRARYYNPVVGRFMQEDVYREDGLNLYAYCENNPVVYYDPSGYKGNSCDKDPVGEGGGEAGGSGKATGRGRNNIKPDPEAMGAHSVYKRDPNTGEVTNYKTYEPNHLNPSGFDEKIGYDGTGKPHVNPVTGESLMPHVHDKTVPGKVREPNTQEIPKKPK